MEQMLTDAQWARLAPLLPGRAGTSGGRGRDNR
ncbi:IS5 family transposase, partial [Hymenobacter sp. CRA2]